jgi:hypothetical protein
MNGKHRHLLKKAGAWLQGKGYKQSDSPIRLHAPREPDAVFKRAGRASLMVEARVINAYRSLEFRALVGDAILRSRHGSSGGKGPFLLAVLMSRMSPMAVRDLHEYSQRYMPVLNWFLMDELGQAKACLDGEEESFSLPDALRKEADGSRRMAQGNVFSPKNQWLLKILLLAGVDRRYWGGPDRPPRSISELAEVSGVSQPSVSSFVMRAERAGFLKRSAGGFHILRRDEMLDEWFYALKHRGPHEIGLRFLYGDEPGDRFVDGIRDYCRKAGKDGSGPALVVGHHLACQLMKLGRSNVRFARIYANRPVAEVLSALDLVRSESAEPQLSLVVPPVMQPVLAGHVVCEGIPVCDILQCYLDVRSSLARGNEQAEFILQKILLPHFERKSPC